GAFVCSAEIRIAEHSSDGLPDGIERLHAKPRHDDQKISGGERIERGTHLAIDISVVPIDRLRKPPALFFGHIAKNPRLGISKVIVPDGVEPLVPQRCQARSRVASEVSHRRAVPAIATQRRFFRRPADAGTDLCGLSLRSCRLRERVLEYWKNLAWGCRAIEFGHRPHELVKAIADDEAVDIFGRIGQRPAYDAHSHPGL